MRDFVVTVHKRFAMESFVRLTDENPSSLLPSPRLGKKMCYERKDTLCIYNFMRTKRTVGGTRFAEPRLMTTASGSFCLHNTKSISHQLLHHGCTRTVSGSTEIRYVLYHLAICKGRSEGRGIFGNKIRPSEREDKLFRTRHFSSGPHGTI